MKHWAFDLDGTLVDSFGHYFSALECIFEKHGNTRFTPAHRLPALTEPVVEFFTKHLKPGSIARALDELQRVSNSDAEHIRPFDGVTEILSRLRAKGSRIAVWTNRDLESTELVLRHSGLAPLVDFTVTGSCVARRKPDPEGLSRITARFECDAAAVTMVGDHEHDVRAARSGGARAIRASWHPHWDHPECLEAHRQFRSLEDLKTWLG